MEKLAQSGVKWVRMDFIWADTEKQKGKYDFSEYDRFMQALAPYGIHSLFILDYDNPLYDEGLSPHTDAGREAFANWAAAAVLHFRGKPVLWEIYNEPNFSRFWRPKANVADYIKLVLAVGEKVEQAAPESKLAGPALAKIDKKFLKKCFEGGALKVWSAVTLHPYRRHSPPETFEKDLIFVRKWISEFAPGKEIPVLSGEWGYSDIWRGMNPEKQGQYVARQWLSNLSLGVPLSIWYDWRDDGQSPKEEEHHYGWVQYADPHSPDFAFRPKPAYLAAQTLTSQLDGFRFLKRIALPRQDDYALLFEKGNEIRLVAWSLAAKPHYATLPAAPDTFKVVGHTGQNHPDLSSDSRGLCLLLSQDPLYLSPSSDNRVLKETRAWISGNSFWVGRESNACGR
ncbi:MAG: beta-1,4-xylanase [bacterium]